MKARAHTAVLLLTLALLALPAHVRTQQQEPVVLRYRGFVYPGDTFAPHLYDLHFDGVNQYASVPSFTFPQVFTVVLSVKAYPKYSVHNSHEVAFGHPDLWSGTASLTLEDTLFGVFRVFDTAGRGYALTYYSLYDEGVFTHVAAQYDGARMRLYKNGVLVNERSAPSTLRYPANDLHLFRHGDGVQHNNIVASSFLIYSRALTAEEVSNAMGGVVSADGLRLFIDPTFFDGTKYVDLSGNGNHAYPYNG
ncbi:MAG: LamG domain-containing protein, partial [Sulfolobales archaeon]